MSQTGMIFDVKRFAIHDGPGIRTTVFFKGCALACPWCHNPEGLENRPEIALNRSRCLNDCLACVRVCRPRALRRKDQAVQLDRSRCDRCGECARACPSEAIQLIGRVTTVAAILEEIDRDEPFYQQDGGGVTFSGGEPLRQPGFLKALLVGCKSRGYHVALDTSGFADRKSLAAVAADTDLFLYDLKAIDDRVHRRITGASNRLILENLRWLAGQKKRVVVRLPLIPGFTATDDNIAAVADWLQSMTPLRQIELLNFHRWGRQKYDKLGKPDRMADAQPLPSARLNEIKNFFSGRGFSVTTGG